MIEQDYIMRMINVLGAALARVLLLRKTEDYPGALLEIQTTGKTLLGVHRALVDLLSPEQLMNLFGSDVTVAMPKSYVLGILLHEESAVRRCMGEESDLLSLKSLSLLLDTLIAAGGPIETRHTEVIDALIVDLRDRALPPSLLVKIMRYQEFMGRYDRAENVLFDLLAVQPASAREGRDFYQRLLSKTDAELEAGGLPRSEVLEGMAALGSTPPP